MKGGWCKKSRAFRFLFNMTRRLQESKAFFFSFVLMVVLKKKKLKDFIQWFLFERSKQKLQSLILLFLQSNSTNGAKFLEWLFFCLKFNKLKSFETVIDECYFLFMYCLIVGNRRETFGEEKKKSSISKLKCSSRDFFRRPALTTLSASSLKKMHFSITKASSKTVWL